jgi:hypothetical protein
VKALADVDALATALQEVDNLEESLLDGLLLTHFEFSAELRFTQVRRGRPVDESRHVVVEMIGVSTLSLQGGLTAAMLKHPERVNWGLSELATVSAYPCSNGFGLPSWEDERGIRVEANQARFCATAD